MLKILQARLQQYVNCELPNVQAGFQQYMSRELLHVQTGFRKGRGTGDQIVNIHWIMQKAKEFQEKHLLLLHRLR